MKSWKRKLRMGMVGGGPGAFIGAVHRTAAAMDLQCEVVAGAFSQSYEKSKQTGEELYLDPKRVYSSYQAMAEAEAKLPEGDRIDFCTVVTPNVSHFDIAKTFLEAGFHVACDKPMTYTLEQAEQLVKIVEKTKRVFMVTYNYTGFPLVRHARDLFRHGEMGQVRKVLVEFIQDFLNVAHEKLGQKQAMWRTDPAQSGIVGTLGDIGTHCFNLVEYVTGERIVQLCADMSIFMPDRKLDEDTNMLLRFAGGGKGVLAVSQVSTGEDNGLRLRAYAAEGAVLWDQENPNYLGVYRYGEPRQSLMRGHGNYLAESASLGTRLPPGHQEGYIEAFANLYNGFFEAVRAALDKKPMKMEQYAFPTVHDGLRAQRFIAKAVESHQQGAVWVDL
jgi:predicted dehydrogenase